MPFKQFDVAKEYEKNDRLRKEDVENFMKWVEKQPHLPEISEHQAILFLHSCHYGLEFSKTCLDHYFTLRTHHPEIFSVDLNDPLLSTLMDTTLLTILPEKTPEGYSILFLKFDPNPDTFHSLSAYKLSNMDVMLDLNLHGTNEGYYVLVDTEGTKMTHLLKLDLTRLKTFFFYLQEAIPMRLKGIHLINLIPFADRVVSLFRQFMKNELLSVLHFHAHNEDLYKYIPQSCLPKDYPGGEAPFVSDLLEMNKKLIKDNLDFFEQHQHQRVDETRREEKNNSTGEIFGMDGSFRKLEVD